MPMPAACVCGEEEIRGPRVGESELLGPIVSIDPRRREREGGVEEEVMRER